ncbi:MAG: hypothetical protein QOJ92_1883 [Frankiales bacterium]|nr:hypothetical protein [Frankiales bacterium]
MRRALAVGLLLAVALAGCSKSNPAPSRLSGVKSFSNLSKGHKRGHLTYPQTPPVGGNHSPAWLKCAVYTEAVPNENAVHSLEHGAVWLTYTPDLTAADVARLVALDSINPDYILISPYPGQPSPVMATAWGYQLAVTSADDARLADFVKAYAGGGQGGEAGADCARQGLSPAQARQLLEQAG